MTLKHTLLTAAAAYCSATGMSKARLATIIANDGKFFARVERGGGFTASTFERAMQWFADHWPAQTPWPFGSYSFLPANIHPTSSENNSAPAPVHQHGQERTECLGTIHTEKFERNQ